MTASRQQPQAIRPLLAGLALACSTAAASAADDSVRLATMSENELQAGMKSGVQMVMQRVPMQMDDQSVLVGAEYDPSRRVATYHYLQARQLDPSALRDRLTAKNCNSPNTRAMMSRGITFRHLYMVGDHQFDVTVREGDCAARG